MKCLIAIPHIFDPKKGGRYSSQDESKREEKIQALKRATTENLCRHNMEHLIHASLGKEKAVVNRKCETKDSLELKIQLYTNKEASLVSHLEENKNLEIIYVSTENNMKVPGVASKRLIEQWKDYDILGYMEDDILIEDYEFFNKIKYLHEKLPFECTVVPHRCEYIENKGDVILSGDPDGGRPDLFWDTKEEIEVEWSSRIKTLYRATNPHSGCFFISQMQARALNNYWSERNWESRYQLAGPLEHAASGRLIEVMKIFKTKPEFYRFFMVRHQDKIWRKHSFEK